MKGKVFFKDGHMEVANFYHCDDDLIICTTDNMYTYRALVEEINEFGYKYKRHHFYRFDDKRDVWIIIDTIDHIEYHLKTM